MSPGPNQGVTLEIVMRTMAARPGTTSELAKAAKLSRCTIQKYLRKLRPLNLVHVDHMRHDDNKGGGPWPVYAIGPAPGADAPTFDLDATLKAMQAEIQGDRRKGIERRMMERELREYERDQERRQAQPPIVIRWDPLVAALFGPAAGGDMRKQGVA